jgi:hypothetical protein
MIALSPDFRENVKASEARRCVSCLSAKSGAAEVIVRGSDKTAAKVMTGVVVVGGKTCRAFAGVHRGVTQTWPKTSGRSGLLRVRRQSGYRAVQADVVNVPHLYLFVRCELNGKCMAICCSGNLCKHAQLGKLSSVFDAIFKDSRLHWSRFVCGKR